MVAHRTLDNGKKTPTRAGSTAAPEDGMAGAADDLPEDEQAAASASGDESEDGEMEQAPADEVDEDLRIASTTSAAVAPVAARRAVGGGNTIIDRLLANPVTRFPTESGIELWSKVTWPEPRYAWNMTLIVIAMSVFVAVILGAADLGLSQFVNWVTSHAGAAPVTTPTPAPAVPIPGQP